MRANCWRLSTPPSTRNTWDWYEPRAGSAEYRVSPGPSVTLSGLLCTGTLEDKRSSWGGSGKKSEQRVWMGETLSGAWRNHPRITRRKMLSTRRLNVQGSCGSHPVYTSNVHIPAHVGPKTTVTTTTQKPGEIFWERVAGKLPRNPGEVARHGCAARVRSQG